MSISLASYVPAVLLTVPLAIPLAARQSAGPETSITALRMLDVVRGAIVEDAVIVIQGERIVAAGSRSPRRRAARSWTWGT